MFKFSKFIVFGWIVLLFFAVPVEAGRCSGDSSCSSCKNCRYCKHCSNGGTCGVCSSGSSRQTAPRIKEAKTKTVYATTPSTTKAVAAINTSSINEYFRGGNENVGALSCGQTIYERNVENGTKHYVKNRDGNKCVICGSRNKLEVDHRRALMNGGTNDESNLFTLCDDCHTEKTRMDNSLKRKRNKICKN